MWTPPSSCDADMKALEEEVRAIHKDGLLWGACELGCLRSAATCCLLLCLDCLLCLVCTSELWPSISCQHTPSPCEVFTDSVEANVLVWMPDTWPLCHTCKKGQAAPPVFCVKRSTDQLSAPCPAAKLVPIGFGIRKLQITAVIEDAKVESMDSILEEELVRDGESETIQSADIAAFNKLVSR